VAQKSPRTHYEGRHLLCADEWTGLPSANWLALPRLEEQQHKPAGHHWRIRRHRSRSSDLSIRKRSGQKLVLVPGGTAAVPDRPRIDNATVKALARAFRWRKLLETGAYGTLKDIAKAEKINASYVSRVLRMTLLAPNMAEVKREEELAKLTGRSRSSLARLTNSASTS
jgi:hypothetical protein